MTLVWYHQIRIQNFFGFIVLILIYILHLNWTGHENATIYNMQKGGNFKVVNDKTNQRKIASLFLDNYPFNLHTWDFLGHELEEKKSGQAPNFVFYLPYETQLFLRLPSWKNSGWILPNFFRVAKVPIFSKLKIGCRLKGRGFSDMINKNN